MNWLKLLNMRTLIFVAGTAGAIFEAIDIAQRADVHVKPAHLVALACTALVTYAMKWPGDVTASDAKEQVARAKRESIAPPPGYDPKQEDSDGP